MRYRARAELAGRLFDEVLVDIGISEPLIEDPEIVRGTDLLEFADTPVIEVPTLPLEQHIAEKVHAYTRTYGEGQSSSRAKDLVDLVLLRLHASPRAAQLRRALESVFAQRHLQELPSELPPPPAEWRRPYGTLATEVGIDPDLVAGHRQASEMIDRVLAGEGKGKWRPEKGIWS